MDFDKIHEDFKLLLYGKAMSNSFFIYGDKKYYYITIRDALKFIGAYDVPHK